MLHGETIHSTLPWDLPWWSSDFFVFFGTLYLVLAIIGAGVGFVAVKSYLDTLLKKSDAGSH